METGIPRVQDVDIMTTIGRRRNRQRRRGPIFPRMHASPQLRPGTPQDDTTIAALAIQVYLDTYAIEGIRPDIAREALRDHSPQAYLARLHRAGSRFVLAEIGTGLVGFAEVDLTAEPGPDTGTDGAELVRLYVQPAFQRARVGSMLLAAAEDVARASKAPALWLTAWEGNQRARDFYAARGYADVGETFHVIEGQRFGNRVFRRSV